MQPRLAIEVLARISQIIRNRTHRHRRLPEGISKKGSVPLFGNFLWPTPTRLPDLAMQGLLNLLPEAIVPQRSPGLHRSPDIMHLVWIQCASEQFPVGATSFFLIPAERQIQGMRGNGGLLAADGIDSIAGPAIVIRRGDHARAHRIEFDITHACEQVVLTGNQTPLVPSFPKRAAFSIGMVHIRDVTAADILNQSADGFSVLGGDQQMDMIGHQHVGMNRTIMLLRAFVKPVQVRGIILITKERRLTTIAALDNMSGDARQIEARLSWHVTALVTFVVVLLDWSLEQTKGTV